MCGAQVHTHIQTHTYTHTHTHTSGLPTTLMEIVRIISRARGMEGTQKGEWGECLGVGLRQCHGGAGSKDDRLRRRLCSMII